MSSEFEIVPLVEPGDKKDGDNADIAPPIDPTYIAELDKRGRIVHEIGHDEVVWSNKRENKDKESTDAEKAEGKREEISSNVLLQPQTQSEAPRLKGEGEEAVRPAPFPEPEVIELVMLGKSAEDEMIEAAKSPTRVLSLSEAAAQRKKEEAEASENERKKRIEKEYAVVKERQARDEEVLKSDRAKQWRFWSTMPSQINTVGKEIAALSSDACAYCAKTLCETKDSKNADYEIVSETAASDKQPWNADLAADDVDAEAIARMRTECIKKVARMRQHTKQFEKCDPWTILPCRHPMHGFPCTLRTFQKKATHCPRCRAAITSITPSFKLALSSGKAGDKDEKKTIEEEQMEWIESTLHCPPPLLAATNLHIDKRPLIPPPQPQRKNVAKEGKYGGDALLSSSSSSSFPLKNRAPMRSRDKMDLAHERLVQKYILLDKMNLAAAGEQNADEFMNAAERLESLEPEKSARSHLWQTLEPPSEHRPNIDRALALTKAVAAMDDPRPLDWLAKRGFIDRDTVTALSKIVNASWIASLPRAAQKTLLGQVSAAGKVDDVWWKAIVESGLHDPTAVRQLFLDARGKERAESRSKTALERWAGEAERHGRFALAIELHNIANEQSSNTE